jgi:hypothetical protein
MEATPRPEMGRVMESLHGVGTAHRCGLLDSGWVVSALDRRDVYDMFVGFETRHVLEVDAVGHELRVRTLWTL